MTMPEPVNDMALRAMLARAAYDADRVRLTGLPLGTADCLVASRQGLFAVGRDGTAVPLAHGFFFGIRALDDGVLLFEAGDRSHAPGNRGRLVQLRIVDGGLGDPRILVRGLDNQGHQVAIFDDTLWVVDTAHQRILGFAPDGTPRAEHRPFPPASRDDTGGGYLHLNGLARVGDRIALMLHNGQVQPPRASELAWLDRDWTLIARRPIAGHSCHDIVVDERGVLWHCDSMAGDVISSAGDRLHVTERMTRGLAITPDTLVVGTSNFARREQRDDVAGTVIYLDRTGDARTEVMLPGAPTDLLLL